MIKFIKRIQAALSVTEREVPALRARIKDLERIIEERTALHCDISPTRHDISFAVMIGRYGDIDYVQTFYLRNDDFRSVVNQLKDRAKHTRFGRCDAPPAFSTAFKREF